VVLGLGFATLVPQRGDVAMAIDDVAGVDISGIIFDAGPRNSRLLLQVGTRNAHRGSPDNPTALQDVFFRIGGAAAGKATVASRSTATTRSWTTPGRGAQTTAMVSAGPSTPPTPASSSTATT